MGLQTNLRKYEKAREVFNCLIKNAEVWIESEKLYEVLYSFEMEGNNDAQEE